MNYNKDELDKMIKDESNYKFAGLIYFNKKDNRIFPPKRFKWMGWTINFANKYSVLALLIIIGLIILISGFI